MATRGSFAFYARRPQVSMCRAIETGCTVAKLRQLPGKIAARSHRSEMDQSHKFIESVDH